MTTHEPLPPGSTIAILGGGQLGRMLAVAAARLGLRSRVLSDRPDDPAFTVAAETYHHAFDDDAAIARFATGADVVTYEFENVPLSAIDNALEHAPVHPGRRPLAITQDRLAERKFLDDCDIPVAPYVAVDSLQDLAQQVSKVALPAILKTRRFGYDGKGQTSVNDVADLPAAWAAIAAQPAILERRINFQRELSIIAVRGLDGATVFYDLTENHHADHVLRTSTVPARAPDSVEQAARRIAERIVAELDYVGTIAIEFFLVNKGGENTLLVNEIAPRVHNSGHWTLDAAHVDQFENHVRAIAGWPLGDTARHSNAVMTNLIGEEVQTWQRLADKPATCLHIYGKRTARPGRKMAHVTTLSPMT